MTGDVFRLLQERFPAERARPLLTTADGRSDSYADMEAATARIAHLLGRLARPGDRLIAKVEKSPEALYLYLACARAGIVYLPLNPGYSRGEVGYLIQDAEPACIVCPSEEAAMMAELAGALRPHVLTLDAHGRGSLMDESAGLPSTFETLDCAPDDLAALLYTSGTTGRPKGAMITHRNLSSNAFALIEAWGFTGFDVLLHALPIFHTHGLFVASHCVLGSGASMLFLPRFEVDRVLELLPRATVMMGVPTFYVRMLQSPRLTPELCRNMRLFISGSAPLLPETHEQFRARTGHAILERYGMTETNMICSNPLHGARKPGTVGRPLPGIELRIRADGRTLGPGEIGMVELRGPNVFKGYWRMPEKTREELTDDGFFRTGDLGMWDEDGYVRLVGRAKDLIISGGFNVYPSEVEGFIDELEGVAESAVIGVPHPDFGEAVVAVIRAKDPEDPPAPEAIVSALRDNLAGYKLPKRVVFVEELPRNAMGKVEKSRLRAAFAEVFRSGA